MQLAGSTLQLAAYDLGRFLSCRHCTALDMEVANGDRTEPHFADRFLEIRVKRGLAHEKEYVESIGTVDRFQGQEAAVVIYSIATSRPEDAPTGMEFLYDLNRLNLATSRAPRACILVASPRLECESRDR